VRGKPDVRHQRNNPGMATLWQTRPKWHKKEFSWNIRVFDMLPYLHMKTRHYDSGITKIFILHQYRSGSDNTTL